MPVGVSANAPVEELNFLTPRCDSLATLVAI